MRQDYNPIEWHRVNTHSMDDLQLPVCANCGHLFVDDSFTQRVCEYCGHYGYPTTLGKYSAERS